MNPRRRPRQPVERDLLSGQFPSYEVEKRYRHARGYYFWVLVSVSPVRDDRGQLLYVIKQVQDISERKELAERLEYLGGHDFLDRLIYTTNVVSSKN